LTFTGFLKSHQHAVVLCRGPVSYKGKSIITLRKETPSVTFYRIVCSNMEEVAGNSCSRRSRPVTNINNFAWQSLHVTCHCSILYFLRRHNWPVSELKPVCLKALTPKNICPCYQISLPENFSFFALVLTVFVVTENIQGGLQCKRNRGPSCTEW